MRKITLLCLILLLSKNVLGQDNQNPADFIMKAVVQRAKENENLKKELLSYKKTFRIDNLRNNNDQFKSKEKEEVLEVRDGEERIVERNGIRLRKPEKPSERDRIDFNDAMVNSYDFELMRVEMIDDRAYHIIKFTPKKNVRANTDLQEIINRLVGNIYVDVEKLFIHRLTGNLTREYSRLKGIYRLSRADISMEQEEFNGIIVMKQLVVIDRYTISFLIGSSTTLEKRSFIYTDYKRLDFPP